MCTVAGDAILSVILVTSVNVVIQPAAQARLLWF